MISHLPAIRAYRRAAHLMVLHRAETPLARSVTKFGGLPYLLQDEQWPICSRCRRPMSFVFQANFGDIPGTFRLGDYDLLTFYYCLNCCPRSSEEAKGYRLQLYRTAPGDALQLAHFALRRDEVSEPRECAIAFRLIEDLPPAETVVTILGTDERVLREYERYVERLRGGNLCASKIGGYPYWIQVEPTLRCRCGVAMRFLAQIESEIEANLLWGDNGLLYLFHCPQLCSAESVGFLIQSE